MSPKIKYIILFVAFAAFSASYAAEVTCTRSFSPANYVPGENVTVTLTIDVDENNKPSNFGIEEIFPTGWTFVIANPTEGQYLPTKSQLGWLFWSMGLPVADTTITYIVQPPVEEEGIKNFSGTVSYSSQSYLISGDTDISRLYVPPTVGFSLTASSGPEATAAVTLDVELSSPSWKTVTVDYSVTGGTADGGGVDYTLASDTLTFPAGDTSEEIKIAVLGDEIYENDDTITVTLSDPLNAELGNNFIHTYTIENDDDPPILEFVVDSSEGFEDPIPALPFVNISGESSLTAKVYFSITPGTATGGEDYTIMSGWLEFSPGQTDPEEAIKIPILEDLLDEDDETFTVTLSNATDATIGTKDSHTYTIRDDDPPPEVSFTQADSEGKEGTVSQVTLVVNLSTASGKTVTVDYSVTGTADEDVDFNIAAGPLTFAPGEITKNITITIIHDTAGEADETVIVTLDPTNATLGDYPSYTYTILNDDLSSIEFAEVSSSGPESDDTVTLAVTLLPAIDQTVTVNYSVTGGTATGSDYTLADGTLTFPKDDTEESIKIDITHDTYVEPDETIIVTLSKPSEDATIGTNASHTYTILNDDDETPPETSGFIPERGAIQVARDTIIQLHITDEIIASTSGVDLDTVKIQVAGKVIYNGDVDIYNSGLGICRRIEIKENEDYLFVFQPSTLFDYEQEVEVVVYAEDKAGRFINDPYYFYTVMRSFGKNIKVNSDTGALVQNNPATAIDSKGNIWVVWDDTTAAGDSDIYIGKLPADGSAFKTSVPVIKDPNNQRNPAIAIDDNNKLYVVWEEFEEIADPNRDILLLTSTDGTNWKYDSSSEPFKVNVVDPDTKDPHFAQNPAIDISGTEMYVTWDEKKGTNKDIWVRQSAIAPFDWKVATQVTDDASAQSEPAIAIDKFGTAYIVWTDERNAAGTDTGMDIYGADSTNWTNNVEVVRISDNQWSPAIAAESSGTVLHLLWVDDTDPSASIFYRATTDGLTGLLDVDLNVVDEPYYVQSVPAIAVSGAGETAKVFACWQDGRWINYGDVADIYFTESGSGFDDRTNVLVNDDGVDENTQTAPDIGDIGVDKYGNPYIVWVDDRNGNNDIYYAGATSIQDLTKEPVSVLGVPNAITVPTTQANLQVTITNLDDENAHVAPSTISIGEVRNLSVAPPQGGFGLMYNFGPSGLEFDPPATIMIPLAPNAPSYSKYIVYWWDSTILPNGAWTTDGIHNPATKSSDGTYLEVQVDHFSVFQPGGFSGVSGEGGGGGGGGGGGCDISPNSQGNVIEYMLPYVFLTIVWIIIKRKDARNRKTIV